jgi:hypothetical protein
MIVLEQDMEAPEPVDLLKSHRFETKIVRLHLPVEIAAFLQEEAAVPIRRVSLGWESTERKAHRMSTR